ncbi:DUF4111 domain-containing protein [Streptomyces sp. DSM 44915]|uniref:DUF4111 domain-containing protein n=1 Tax=Streptomyces chisholmiae TaxID=3075540 RepID=A0ABU2JPW8_9ACTN|nr:aminoglycoside adenylyltransferase domain-containing protein [Streptomyces sp. DSM 44915]MDT0267045.1 DUF4111 domain-containing protein [Streptomyces sp. DSM 44915]
MDEVLTAVLDHLDRERPGGPVGAYLYGSAAAGGLRPESDLDLLLVVSASLSAAERRSLVALLLAHSGWRGHAETFPAAAARRPVELTVLTLDQLGRLDQSAAGAAPPAYDFQYGEWLRAELVAGRLPRPTADPDVVILLATARSRNRVLRGPELTSLLPAIAPDRLRRAVLAVVPELLAGVAGDERNALLTLARVVVTLETGEIVPKDAAAAAVAPRLPAPARALLAHARAGYLGLVTDDWSGRTDQAAELAHTLAELARRQAGPTGRA